MAATELVRCRSAISRREGRHPGTDFVAEESGRDRRVGRSNGLRFVLVDADGQNHHAASSAVQKRAAEGDLAFLVQSAVVVDVILYAGLVHDWRPVPPGRPRMMHDDEANGVLAAAGDTRFLWHVLVLAVLFAYRSGLSCSG